MKENVISIRRVPGTGRASITATISFEFNPDSVEAVERFGRVMRELIPEDDERAKFLEDFNAAAVKAGFRASA